MCTCLLQFRDSPLHRATWTGRYEVMEMMLQAGVPVDIKDDVSIGIL